MNRTFLPQTASSLYSLCTSARNRAYDLIPSLCRKAPRRVISIGGIRAGGTGKTPCALLTGKKLMEMGFNVAFLSRGYGRKERQPVIAEPRKPQPWELIGDEPALLHRNLPQSWLGIGSKRVTVAEKLGHLVPENTIFVLDDGFQHRRIRRDLDIVCLNSDLFSDRMIPMGYMRESLNSLCRADLALVIGSFDETVEDLNKTADRLRDRFRNLTVLILKQRALCWVNCATGLESETLPFTRPSLICGIARPHRFIDLIKFMHIEISMAYCFKDHYVFQMSDLIKKRILYSEGIITTEKDYMRLCSLDLDKAVQESMWYLKMELDFTDQESSEAFFSTLQRLKHN